MKPTNVYIETYGCQMNKLDTENVHAILASDGFNIVSDMSQADVILFNTCSVRENAERRVRGRIAELSALRKKNPELFLGVIGCMAQELGERLLSKEVRIIAGPDSYRKLPVLLRQACNEAVVDTIFESDETYEDIKPVRTSPVSAWVGVMRGCNNYCSYCIVPYTRGRERSIPSDSVIAEVEDLKKSGWKEITLIGQNVNSYRDGDVDFAGLLKRVSDTGIDRIRFLTSHPKDLTIDILDVILERDNICPHLHLPLQSGSDRVLKAMNRGYTISDYMSLIKNAREIVTVISITTDMIFGFPGETEEDFQASLTVMEMVRYDFAFLYRYSEREGTKACHLPGSVPEEIRIDRLKKAIELQNTITHQNNEERIGSETVILVKALSKDGKGWFGFSETSIPVVFTSESENVKIGDLVNVQIESTTGSSLVGKHLYLQGHYEFTKY